MVRKFDLIVFGVTGFTGGLVAEYIAKNYGPSGTRLKYAFAGRSQQKLEDVKAQLSLKHPAAKDVELIVATTDNEGSIRDMCAAAQVVVSTVGPFGKYGEVVVRCCVDTETHYCDITAELHWMRSMIDKYHENALTKKVKIVNCCGFDCVPCDLGTYLLQKHAKQEMGTTLERVNFRLTDMMGGVSGGTIASLFDVLSLPKKLLTQINDPYFLCGNGSPVELAKVRQPDPYAVIFDDLLEKYTAPYIVDRLIDARVVRRSNFLLNYEYGKSFQYHETTSFSQHWLFAKCAVVVMSVVGRLLGFTFVRTLLRKVLPKQGEGPSVQTRENGYFWCRLFGECADSGQGRRMITATVGSDKGDPAYNETAKMLVESALCLILSSESLTEIPKTYGVITPSVAFGMALVERLNSAGMTFKIDSSAKK